MRTYLVAAALLLTACSGGGPDAGATVFEDSSGVRVARNDDKRPGWTREQRWALASNPRLQVGNVLGDPDQQLYHVAHARRLRNASIVVANNGMGDLRVFDSLGAHTRTVPVGDPVTDGPLRVWELPGTDSLLVYQADLSLSVFDVQGNRARKAPLTHPGPEFEEDLEPLGAFKNGSLLFRARFLRDSTMHGVGRRRIRLLRYGTDGTIVDSFGDFDGQAVLFEDHGAYIFGPDASAAPADSTVWYSPGDRYELREIAPGGRTLRVVRLDRPGTKVLQADVTSYRQAATRQVEGTERAKTMQATLEASTFADTFPVIDRLIVDEAGDVWVRNYQWFDLGSGKSWTLFDPEGRYLGQIGTPSILDIHQIGATFLVGRMSDGRGHEAVYLYDLIKPGSGPAPGP